MPTDIGDIIEVAARSEFNGVDDIVNVYQFALGTPGPISDADTATDILNIMEALYTLLNAAVSILVLYRDIRIRNITKSTVLGTFNWPTLTNGSVALDALPPGNAGLVNFNTDIARVTPRKYYGGLTVGSLDPDGSLEPGTTAILVAVGASLLSVQVGAFGDWLYGYLSPKTLAFEFPLSATVSDISAYQRRRKQGRGS